MHFDFQHSLCDIQKKIFLILSQIKGISNLGMLLVIAQY
jgi:hypothetical protein